MTRIDHAAEAREWLRDAPIEQHQHNDLSRAALCVHMAKAEATLALVEQQRIANLIALSQAEDGNGWTSEQALTAVFREHWNDESGQGHCTIAPDIAAALGIGEPS